MVTTRNEAAERASAEDVANIRKVLPRIVAAIEEETRRATVERIRRAITAGAANGYLGIGSGAYEAIWHILDEEAAR